MNLFLRSSMTALMIAAAIQMFTVGFLSPRLSLEVCRPGVQLNRELRFEGATGVAIASSDGAVQVQTHALQEILVTASIRAYTPDAETQALAERYVQGLVTSTETDGLVEIVTEPEFRPDDVDLQVDYTVRLPEGASFRLEGSNGNVWIAAGCGDIVIQGNNTDVEILEPQGSVEATVANGRIRVSEARARTALATVNGSVYVDMAGGTLEASTANGNIVAQLLSDDVESCDLTAMNGGITLSLSEGCSAEVDATTERGQVRPALLMDELQGVLRRREVRGTLGGGKTRLTMSSLNGDILIARSGS